MPRESARRDALNHISLHHGGCAARMRGVYLAFNSETVACLCPTLSQDSDRFQIGPDGRPHHSNCVKHLLLEGVDIFDEYLSRCGGPNPHQPVSIAMLRAMIPVWAGVQATIRRRG